MGGDFLSIECCFSERKAYASALRFIGSRALSGVGSTNSSAVRDTRGISVRQAIVSWAES